VYTWFLLWHHAQKLDVQLFVKVCTLFDLLLGIFLTGKRGNIFYARQTKFKIALDVASHGTEGLCVWHME